MTNEGFSVVSRAMRIETALRGAFDVRSVVVIDDSARHAGHAGASEQGETHYNIEIIAADFTGMSRIARHRAVNAALAAEFADGLHALAISAKAPDEG